MTLSETCEFAQLKEATRVRPSKAAMLALREELEAQQAMAYSPRDTLVAGGLRILLEMAEKLPCP